MRGISSVVDVTVFLLLVSAAVATLALVPDPKPDAVMVDDRANVLSSVTADVEYTHGGADRQAHGTVASLLARGAIANATVDGRPLSDDHRAFARRIRNVTLRTLGPENRTQVVVRWTPYGGSPIRGTFRVGPTPPPRRDVSVTTITVPAPTSRIDGRAATQARTSGFRGVASATARTTADALLPESRATLPSGRPSPGSAVVSDRFRTLADATRTSVDGPLSRGNVSLARRRIVEGLTDRFAADMRTRFDEPVEAAESLRIETVRIALRRWES